VLDLQRRDSDLVDLVGLEEMEPVMLEDKLESFPTSLQIALSGIAASNSIVRTWMSSCELQSKKHRESMERMNKEYGSIISKLTDDHNEAMEFGRKLQEKQLRLLAMHGYDSEGEFLGEDEMFIMAERSGRAGDREMEVALLQSVEVGREREMGELREKLEQSEGLC